MNATINFDYQFYFRTIEISNKYIYRMLSAKLEALNLISIESYPKPFSASVSSFLNSLANLKIDGLAPKYIGYSTLKPFI